MSNQLSSPSPIVSINHGKVTTTSLDIAKCFAKRHDNVLRCISNLECSSEFTALNFELSTYTDCTGRNLPVYNITRDGFIFLVTGFTGKKAAQFKEAYIKAFNEMESALLNKQTPVFETVTVNLEALRALVNDVLWLEQTFNTFKLIEAIKMLGGYELASRLQGRISDSRLAIALLRANKTLRIPQNP